MQEFQTNTKNKLYEGKRDSFSLTTDVPKENLLNKFSSRLNQVDSQILEDTAHKTLDNDSLKIEIQIERLNNKLIYIQEYIKLWEILEINADIEKVAELKKQEEMILGSLDEVKSEYKKLGIMYNLSNGVSNRIEKASRKLTKTKTKQEEIMEKIPFFKFASTLKGYVEKLNFSYKKLNEITAQKETPFGEENKNVQMFVALLNKVNALETRVNKIIEKRNKKPKKVR